MLKNAPRVVSLVPSWTETLIAAGISVVGRTRFCIYPESHVQNISIVGGTKKIDIQKIKQIQPDFVLLDQQENTKQMAEELSSLGIKTLITNVTDFSSLRESLLFLDKNLGCPFLLQMAKRYDQAQKKINKEIFLSQLILKGQFNWNSGKKSIEYVIWKNPFMVIGENTFIAENWKLIDIYMTHKEKYPKINENELKNSFCIFSSEPYPFLNYFDELVQNGFQGVVVDAEKISWFGIRNLNFLESCAQ